MAKTLAELRANRPQGYREEAVTVCLNQHLVAEMQSLGNELNNLTADVLDVEGEEQEGPPPRLAGRKDDPRVAEIRDRMAELLREIAAEEGEFRLRDKKSDGEWRRWCNEHPARKDGEPGFERDLRVASGHCNADDLIDDLGSFVHSWNGDELQGADWADIFESSVSSPDKAQMAAAVVSMYEVRLDFQRWRSNLSAGLKRLSDFDSHETSGSPTSDSTAGSPAPRKSATTETASA